MDASTANVIKGRAPLRASAALRAAIRSRKGKCGTISYLYSAKTDKDLVVVSDLELAHVLHLEGREDVKSFEIDVDRIAAYLDSDGYVGTRPDARVHHRNGKVTLVEVKYSKDLKNDLRTELQVAAQRKHAAEIGAQWTTFSEKNFEDEERVIHDWLHIVVVLGETRDKVRPSLQETLLELINEKTSQTLSEISSKNLARWDLAFSAAFRLIQAGSLISDLRQNPLSWNTVLRPGR